MEGCLRHSGVRGCWFVWGNSGNGKTSFVMQLCKELCKYDRVAFNSLEEGTSLTVQNNLRRFGMAEVSRHLAFIKEDIPTLKISSGVIRVSTS